MLQLSLVFQIRLQKEVKLGVNLNNLSPEVPGKN